MAYRSMPVMFPQTAEGAQMTIPYGEVLGPGPSTGTNGAHSPDDERRHAPATLRNRQPLLDALLSRLPEGRILEIACGTGEHAAYLAPRLPGRHWLPTDPNRDALASTAAWLEAEGVTNTAPPTALDTTAPVEHWPVTDVAAILCINMIHIAPWGASEGLMAGAQSVLPPGGTLILYGPFQRHGAHTAPSNMAFDAGLRGENPEWGVRDLDHQVVPLAASHGLSLEEIVPMPSNNLLVVFRKPAR